MDEPWGVTAAAQKGGAGESIRQGCAWMRCSYNESAFVLITRFYRQILRVIQFSYLLRNINELRVIEVAKSRLTHRTGGKLTSTLPATGTRNGQIQGGKNSAEIRLRPCFDP